MPLTPPGAKLELNTAVAYAGEPPACQATEGGAVGTSVVVSTAGPPILELTPFGDDEPQGVEFEDGDVITITNVAAVEGHDDEYDYLLNYGIARELPPDTSAPKGTLLQLPRCEHPEIDETLGPAARTRTFRERGSSHRPARLPPPARGSIPRESGSSAAW
ncbi:MAG TPA: hypothetical protein VN181_01490 [Thermoanaerobaculia bacterium]|nr:hypothetical protein [Thermoanaerobaculia bacterium]